jgi:hypothetical protein
MTEGFLLLAARAVASVALASVALLVVLKGREGDFIIIAFVALLASCAVIAS